MKQFISIFLVCLCLPWGCRPAVTNDGVEGAHRCTPGGVPQEYAGGRWHNADRPCRENVYAGGAQSVCCETYSAYAGRVLHACVPSIDCITYVDAGARD